MEPSEVVDPVRVKKEPVSPREKDSHSMKKPTSKHGSQSSTKHSSSSSIMKRAKAEAARALIRLAEEEAALRKTLSQLEEQDEIDQATIRASAVRRRSDYNADMDLLTAKKTAAALDAEARVYEQESVGGDLSEFDNIDDDIHVPEEDPHERTSEYVNTVHLEGQSETMCPDASIVPQNATHRPQSEPQPVSHATHEMNDSRRAILTNNPVDTYRDLPESDIRPQTPATTYAEMPPVTRPNIPMFPDISKFLLRRELLMSRLYQFCDKPETYFVWKSSFKNVLADLQVSDFEQLDLLVKWLGPESSSYALSIRAANADNPSKALRLLWERLDQRYGAPEMIESILKDKLAKFPRLSIKDTQKLFELADLLTEILSLKEQTAYKPLLAYFDSSVGINPIIEKLPHNMREKWISRAYNYKETKQCFPPFKFFADFVREMSRVRNDPSFSFTETMNTPQKFIRSSPLAVKTRITTARTEISSDSRDDTVCAIHGTSHRLSECRAFQTKPLEARKALLREKGLCFKCCDFMHKSRHCREKIKCTICDSDKHVTVMHGDTPSKVHGGERTPHSGRNTFRTTSNPLVVESSCTEICGNMTYGKSCAKILPVFVHHCKDPRTRVKMYIILDDQSNRSLARSSFFDMFKICSPPEEYIMNSCNGKLVTSGRRASGFVMESCDRHVSIDLPVLIECDNIPNNRQEIPSPDVTRYHPHLGDIELDRLDDQCQILLLIGRDVPYVHRILDQKTGHPDAPIGLRSPLGWTVVGDVCLGSQHQSNDVNVYKTFVLSNGRPSLLRPCENQLVIKDSPMSNSCAKQLLDIDDKTFLLTPDDNKPGLSTEDRIFLEEMKKNFRKNSDGNWEAPLPFKSQRPRLPNNRSMALDRANRFNLSLKRDPVKQKHFIDFMQKLFNHKHVEVAPPVDEEEEVWYLPVFGVYHPRKPDQIRGVFDSSATFRGLSLNDVLMSGPDLNNSLLGVLIRFRKEPVAITADIQQMFHCFYVRPDHRNYLRFFWHRNNDFNEDLIEHRMRVHVFGNKPSPSVATYGLHRTALDAKDSFGPDVTDFVLKHFYVDDGLISVPTEKQAVDLMKRTQHALAVHGNLRLHKIASNSKDVVREFDPDDLSKELKSLELSADLPIQRSLGLYWNMNLDTFTFQISSEEKPLTRRGVLSVINSIYDPLGFAAPVTIEGKLILRQLTVGSTGWDEPLIDIEGQKWQTWKRMLSDLQDVSIPRQYVPCSLQGNIRIKLHVFCDASEKAIAAVAYIHVIYDENKHYVGFVIGKTKVAPPHGHTIPRLELCSALLAVEIYQLANEHLNIEFDSVKFYSDSRVVLGYITNQTRRFFIYVSNRVEQILKHSTPEQWNYVPTGLNPADIGTRGIAANKLQSSAWIQGPIDFLMRQSLEPDDASNLITCKSDVNTYLSEVEPVPEATSGQSIVDRFERFSQWSRLVLAFGILKTRARQRRKKTSYNQSVTFSEAENFIISVVQHSVYSEEIRCISSAQALQRGSAIQALGPVLDEQGILRVGGRLNKLKLNNFEKNPAIIPGSHHIATLLVRHHHDLLKHQGRHLTEGAVRSAGLWITGGKRLVSSVIYKCITCKKLRGKIAAQKMADLPADRLEPAPPFTNVGVDVFGPWQVITRKTRGGSASSKRWGVLFTCLVTRAIHIEVVDSLSSSAFINAVRRFTSIRGKVKIFRSDRGTNFIGATDDLKIDTISVEEDTLKKFLYDSGTKWIFNPPHSSHFGGAWERMIGLVRRILDAMLMEPSNRNVTHDVLCTLMAEVTTIINSRPLTPVSADPDNPFVLTPNVLLTQKHSSDFDCPEFGDISVKDMLRSEWKRVQGLANQFWKKWKSDYLHLLQPRRKWKSEEPNIKEGDVVLMKEDSPRNFWPMAVVQKTFKSDDTLVRKIQIKLLRNDKPVILVRPICEVIPLLAV